MSNEIISNMRREGEQREVPVYGIKGLLTIARVAGLGEIVSDTEGTYMDCGNLRYVLTPREELEKIE